MSIKQLTSAPPAGVNAEDEQNEEKFQQMKRIIDDLGWLQHERLKKWDWSTTIDNLPLRFLDDLLDEYKEMKDILWAMANRASHIENVLDHVKDIFKNRDLEKKTTVK